MIQLTRLNNSQLAINSDLIKFVEAAPDTVLTLMTGEKVVVREAVDEVIARVKEFRRSILCGAHAAMRLAGESDSLPAVQEHPVIEPGG
jgi:flagellar protein FlbD